MFTCFFLIRLVLINDLKLHDGQLRDARLGSEARTIPTLAPNNVTRAKWQLLVYLGLIFVP